MQNVHKNDCVNKREGELLFTLILHFNVLPEGFSLRKNKYVVTTDVR